MGIILISEPGSRRNYLCSSPILMAKPTREEGEQMHGAARLCLRLCLVGFKGKPTGQPLPSPPPEKRKRKEKETRVVQILEKIIWRLRVVSHLPSTRTRSSTPNPNHQSKPSNRGNLNGGSKRTQVYVCLCLRLSLKTTKRTNKSSKRRATQINRDHFPH